MKLQSHFLVLSMLGSTLAFGIFDFQTSVDPFGDMKIFDAFGRNFGFPAHYHRPPARQYKFDEDTNAHYIFLRAPQAEHKSFEFRIDHEKNELMIKEHAPFGFNKKFWVPRHVDTSSISAEWIARDLLRIVLPKQQQLEPEARHHSQTEEPQMYGQHENLQPRQMNALENGLQQQVHRRRLEQHEQQRQQQRLQQEHAERQQRLLQQRQAERQEYERQQEVHRQREKKRLEYERRQQLLRQRREQRQQQLLQQQRAERQQRLLRQRQAERQEYERQQEVLRQREAQRLQNIQNRRQLGQTRAEQHEQARLSHERIKRQRAAYQEQLMQQHSRQHQQDYVDHRLRVRTKQKPVANVDEFKEQQVNGAYEDLDSDMLVAEDEETETHASPVKLASAADGYVDTRGIFREY